MDEVQCSACDAVASAEDRYCPACGAFIGSTARTEPFALARRPPVGTLQRAPVPIAARSPAPAAGVANVVDASSPAPRSTAARRRRTRRWWTFGLAFVLVVALVAAGAAASRVHRTFSIMHEVSTPAPVVSGGVLGGDDSVEIDTGPAQSAVAGGATAPTSTPSATATATATAAATVRASATATARMTAPPSATTGSQLPPPPVATGEPTAPAKGSGRPTEAPATTEATATPAATATATTVPSAPATAANPTATPSPTAEISQIERIKNGNFENGDADWYLEGGAGSVETDAVAGTRALRMPGDSYADQGFSFIAGTTYRLTIWGKQGAKGDEAIVGVSYRNESGERLTDLEPPTLTFTATEFEEQTLEFTVPEGVAEVKVMLWKPTGKGAFVVDKVSVRSEVKPTDVAPARAAVDDDAITILVMGVDARPGEAIDIGVRPDSLMVLRLNPRTGSCRILAIPRDTRTELPGYGLTKINHALAVGGIPYQEQVVEALLGLKLDHYVLIDFAGFQDLVDAVGGINIDVPEPFAIDADVSFNAGSQTLDGKHALAYARYRGGPDGDFGRIARQQQVLRGLVRKASKLNVVRSLNELLPAVQDHIRTDLGEAEMARIALDYRDTCKEDSIQMLRLEGYDAWFDDPMLQMQLEYVVVDEAEIERKVRMLVER
jgi:polyisoprenyl-teichoic acid--peptidoglycan teichoic acid transferase